MNKKKLISFLCLFLSGITYSSTLAHDIQLNQAIISQLKTQQRNMDYAKLAEKHIWKKLRHKGLVHHLKLIGEYHVDYWHLKQGKPPLVLLNGFGASVEYQWYKQIPYFSQHYDILMINLLYFGSAIPKKESRYRTSDQVKYLEKILTDLGYKNAIVAGISYGGLVAMEFAHAHPQVVDKVVAVNAPIKYFTQKNIDHIVEKGGVDSIHSFFAPENHRILKRQMDLAMFRKKWIPGFVMKDMHQRICVPYNENWKKLISQLITEMPELQSRQYDFDKPVHLIWGEEDEIAPLSIAKRLHQDLPKSELHILSKTGHLPTMERPKQFKRLWENEIQ